MYCYICPECGCYLDPGEKCDCKDEEKMREERIARSVEKLSHLICAENNGQMRIIV